jgi:hypothetical protein
VSLYIYVDIFDNIFLSADIIYMNDDVITCKKEVVDYVMNCPNIP